MGDNWLQREGFLPGSEQFLNNTDDLEEELRLANVCKNSAQFAKVTKQFEFMLMAASYKLSSRFARLRGLEDRPSCAKQLAAAPANDHQQIKNILVALDWDNFEMPAFLANSKRGQAFVRFYFSKHISKLRLALLLYITSKLIAFSSLCFYYHKQATAGVSGAQVRPTTNVECASESNKHLGQISGETSQANETISKWLSIAGAMLVFWPGAGTNMYGIMATLPVVFHFLPQILIRLGEIRVDPLCFLLDPLGQRRRIRKDLNAIIDEIILTATQPPDYHQCGSDKGQNDHHDKLVSAADRYLVRPRSIFRTHSRFEPLSTATHSDTTTSPPIDRLDRLHFIQMLHQIRNLNLVQPYSFSSDWHNRTLKSCIPLANYGILIAGSGSIFSIILYLLYEWNVRTGQHLGLIECSRQQRAATSLLPASNQSASRWQLDALDEHYRDALMAHDGTWLDRLYLVLLFGVKHYVTPQMVFFFLELCILLMIAAIWASLFTCIFFLGAMDQCVWLEQIELQLRSFLRLTLQLQHQQAEPAKLWVELPGAAAGSPLRSLTIVYLNYELYRRHNGHFQVTTNFLARQFAALTAITFFIVYVIAVNIRQEHTLPSLLSMMAVVSVMNLYLVASSYRFKQTQKIMNMIACLLSRAAAVRLPSCDYAMQLWRRQLLTETELRQFFASNLFGVSVSYQKFILCNAYLVILIFITLNGSKSTSLGTLASEMG